MKFIILTIVQLATNVKFQVFIKYLGRLYKLSCQKLKINEI